MQISIGLVTYSSQKDIEDCLELLCRQKPYEIIVVDNGSKDNTLSLVQSFTCRYESIKWKIISNTENNIGLARRILLENCESNWIAMTDPDCRVPHDWLDKFRFYILKNSSLPALSGGNKAPLTNQFYRALDIMSQSFLGHYNSAQMKNCLRPQLVKHSPTCNIIYNKFRVLEAGNFSARFASVCEDVELNYRLTLVHGPILGFPNNIVLHNMRSDLWSWSKRIFQYGNGHWMVFCEHPQYLNLKMLIPVFYFLFFMGSLISQKCALIFGLYIITLAFVGIYLSIKNRNFRLSPLLFVLMLTTHMAYSLGHVNGLCRTIYLKCDMMMSADWSISKMVIKSKQFKSESKLGAAQTNAPASK